VAVAGDGSVYYAPLVRDEIRKYGPGGEARWTAKRGLPGPEADPVFLPPPRGSTELQVRSRIVNVALVLGPDGRLYALGSDDSSATRLRVDVVDTATGVILATRQLPAAAGARGRPPGAGGGGAAAPRYPARAPPLPAAAPPGGGAPPGGAGEP